MTLPLPLRGGEFLKKRDKDEEFTIFRCAVEGHSSSHHGSRHRADHHVMYGPRPDVLRKKNSEDCPLSSFIICKRSRIFVTPNI